MDPDELVRWAEAEASALLSDMGDRWRHVQAVVARAHEVEHILNERTARPSSRRLHDIGSAPSVAVTFFHALDGARYVRRLGQKRIAGLVAYHSAAHIEAELRGLRAELAEFRDEASTTTAALAYCDMLTGPTGNPVSLRRRIADVRRRYGADHAVYRSMVRARPHLACMIDHRSAPMRRAIGTCWPSPGRRCPDVAVGRWRVPAAALAGANPIPACSGQVIRHRLNRSGDRQLNRALHTIVLARLRDDPETRAYAARRRAEGKTVRDIRRCFIGGVSVGGLHPGGP